MKISLLFPEPPPFGSKFAIDGQDYKLVAVHTQGGINEATRLTWLTHCADCQEPFEVITPLGFTTGQSRRCRTHKQPGKPVNNRKRGFHRHGAR